MDKSPSQSFEKATSIPIKPSTGTRVLEFKVPTNVRAPRPNHPVTTKRTPGVAKGGPKQ